MFCEEVRLLGRDEDGERLRFRPRGTGVVAAVEVVVVVVVVVVTDDEGGGSGS